MPGDCLGKRASELFGRRIPPRGGAARDKCSDQFIAKEYAKHSEGEANCERARVLKVDCEDRSQSISRHQQNVVIARLSDDSCSFRIVALGIFMSGTAAIDFPAAACAYDHEDTHEDQRD